MLFGKNIFSDTATHLQSFFFLFTSMLFGKKTVKCFGESEKNILIIITEEKGKNIVL